MLDNSTRQGKRRFTVIFFYTHLQCTILDKSPWDSTAIFTFLSFLGFLLKQCILFRNFLAVLSPPTLYKVETRKKYWIHVSNIACAVRGGVGPV